MRMARIDLCTAIIGKLHTRYAELQFDGKEKPYDFRVLLLLPAMSLRESGTPSDLKEEGGGDNDQCVG